MIEPTPPRQCEAYAMPFKPGACLAQLERQSGINDNLLFTWRQRYRVDEPFAPASLSDEIEFG
jgi:transposase